MKKALELIGAILTWLDGKKTAIGGAVLWVAILLNHVGISVPTDAIHISKATGVAIVTIGLLHKGWKYLVR